MPWVRLPVTGQGLTRTQVGLTLESVFALRTWVWGLEKKQRLCDFPPPPERIRVTPEAITIQEAEPIRMLRIEVSCPPAHRVQGLSPASDGPGPLYPLLLPPESCLLASISLPLPSMPEYP